MPRQTLTPAFHLCLFDRSQGVATARDAEAALTPLEPTDIGPSGGSVGFSTQATTISLYYTSAALLLRLIVSVVLHVHLLPPRACPAAQLPAPHLTPLLPRASGSGATLPLPLRWPPLLDALVRGAVQAAFAAHGPQPLPVAPRSIPRLLALLPRLREDLQAEARASVAPSGGARRPPRRGRLRLRRR